MVSYQVVKVVVLNCEPSKERMLLSFKLLNDPEPKNKSVGNGQKKGKVVNTGQVPGLLQTSYLSYPDKARGGTYEVLQPREEKERELHRILRLGEVLERGLHTCSFLCARANVMKENCVTVQFSVEC